MGIGSLGGKGGGGQPQTQGAGGNPMNQGLGSMGKGGKGGGGGQPQVQGGKPGMDQRQQQMQQTLAARKGMGGGIGGLYQQGEFMGRPGTEQAGGFNPNQPGRPGQKAPLTAEQADAQFAQGNPDRAGFAANKAAQLAAIRGQLPGGAPAGPLATDPLTTSYASPEAEAAGKAAWAVQQAAPKQQPAFMNPNNSLPSRNMAAQAAGNPGAGIPADVNRTKQVQNNMSGGLSGKGGKGGGGKGGGGNPMNQYNRSTGYK